MSLSNLIKHGHERFADLAEEMYFSGAETGGTYNDNIVGMTIAVRPVRAF